MPHQSYDQNKMSPNNRCSYSSSLQSLTNLHNPSHSLFKLPRLIHTPRLFRLLRTFPIGPKFTPAKTFISSSSQNSALINFNNSLHCYLKSTQNLHIPKILSIHLPTHFDRTTESNLI